MLTTVRLDVRVIALHQGSAEADRSLEVIGHGLNLFDRGVADKSVTVALCQGRDIIHLRNERFRQSPPFPANAGRCCGLGHVVKNSTTALIEWLCQKIADKIPQLRLRGNGWDGTASAHLAGHAGSHGAGQCPDSCDATTLRLSKAPSLSTSNSQTQRRPQWTPSFCTRRAMNRHAWRQAEVDRRGTTD